jgi:thioredoxin-like negative regulator of GroEL
VLVSFVEANRDHIDPVSIDTSAPGNRQLMTRYNVRSVPTLILVRNGQVVSRKTGIAPSRDVLKRWVGEFEPGVR